MSLNCVNFDFRQCNFDEKNNKKDNSGESREGSGRAVMVKQLDMNPLTYTFEVNYATGFRINSLAPRFDMKKLKHMI